MDRRFQEYIAGVDTLRLPGTRRDFRGGEFAALFPGVAYSSGDNVFNVVEKLYVENTDTLNEAAAKFEGDGSADDAKFDSKLRGEIVEMVLLRLASSRGTTIFRLLTGATPEQEAAFNFYDNELGADFTDYIWAAKVGDVQPEDLFEVDQMGEPHLRGIFRASQRRVHAENGVRIQHVARVLSFKPKRSRDSVSTPGWAWHIGEMSQGVARGLFDDNILRALASSGLDSVGFRVAVDLLLDGVAPEYAFECARGAAQC